ncbi:unnamed protein product [Penicillium salamii]|uniref:60S ribosomal protein L29 n=4 Tax=Penicillium TaxID=5073 RepID=A0A9W4JPQ3_9EURO|nr:unnamed protein product [Penicillium salamii]CAG8013675.1 unnamed protein product [Penicillium salamii]CAG8017083.1 unnamed protein product [Penicillium salamii]CAG8059376.1 unnamed protein product [Penicillium salamii]CAG8185177.1 unnamed protein product [Penicillium salamii]
MTLARHSPQPSLYGLTSPVPSPPHPSHRQSATTSDKMAKSKNASQHHNSQKAHRNGIKKPKTNRYPSLKGVDPKFRRNHRHALHGTMKALKERKEGKREIA